MMLSRKRSPGWRDQNKATIARIAEKWLGAIDVRAERIDRAGLEALREAEQDLEASRNPYGVLARTFGSRRSTIVLKYAADSDMLREASTALAVERFRLAHGRYPGSLDELVPAGLLSTAPVSAVTGDPIRLTLPNSGGFELATPATGDKRKTLTIGPAKAAESVRM